MSTVGTSIRIFLADGTPDGVRLVEKSNWTGLALVAPRTLYARIRLRSELGRPAVYVLRGSSDQNPGRPKLYIGEADCASARIDHHLKKLDWWDDLIVFTSKDENLNKAYVRHLEARLVEIALRAKRAELANNQTPQVPRLSEADTADAEGFLDNMLLIYPVLGVYAFEEPTVESVAAFQQPMLFLSGKGAQARGRDLPEGFVVYTDSRARRDAVVSIHAYLDEFRKQLRSEGVLVDDGDALRLTQNYSFPSPSYAAGVLMGRSANGRIEWKDQQGRTLKEIQEASLPDSDEDWRMSTPQGVAGAD